MFLDSYTVIVIIFGVLILGVLTLLFFINRLLLFKREIENRFSSVQTYLDERVQLLERMSDFIQKNLEHEEVLLKDLEKKKKMLEQVRRCEEGVLATRESDKFLRNFKRLSQVYSFLDNNEEYQELINEISVNEERIVYAFQGYDEGVKSYNRYRENLFILRLSKVFRFSDYEYYNK